MHWRHSGGENRCAAHWPTVRPPVRKQTAHHPRSWKLYDWLTQRTGGGHTSTVRSLLVNSSARAKYEHSKIANSKIAKLNIRGVFAGHSIMRAVEYQFVRVNCVRRSEPSGQRAREGRAETLSKKGGSRASAMRWLRVSVQTRNMPGCCPDNDHKEQIARSNPQSERGCRAEIMRKRKGVTRSKMRWLRVLIKQEGCLVNRAI